ncbi:MAG: enoyl-CoA hydratase family protein [Labilithrix sp.]|nr:enoyl-CoA hydratase family protein [Labilithrix sp.]MCW5817318.1 enoyl-CoA hydratase family protein [Labilithrix sp.]
MTINPKTFAYDLSPSGVATITLCRPDRLNSLTFEVYEELRDTFAALDHESAVRSVVVTGQGRAFCSGGDVESIIGELFARDMQGLVAFTRVTGALIRNIRALRRPVVAAVNGTAVGAGAVIALACDFRVASATAKIGFIFPKVGLSGADMGATYLLPRVVGLGRASELLFLGDIIGAEEAHRIGLFGKVVPAEECVPAARALAERLASGPAFANAMTKQMLESEFTMTLDQAIEAEAQVQAICMQHPDFRTSYDAWVAKKPIVFQGSTIPFDAGGKK